MAAESAVRIIFLGDSAQAVRSVSRLESSFAGLGRTATLLTGAIGIAMVGALAGATKAAIDFDRSMRNVNSIAKLSESAFKSLERRVLALGASTGQTPKVLADGLYDIVSSGFKANDAIKILAVSAKAATAGMTTTATASKAVVAVLNAYHLSADKAKNVSSLLFTEVNKGVNTFEELAQNLGDTAPLAAALKIPFSDIAAGLALITLHGTSMAEASTQMSRVMADLLKPSKDLKTELHNIGFESGQAAIDQLGFIGVIQKLSDAAKGNTAATASWFQNIRSLRGMLNLTGPNLQKFNQFAREMADSFRKGGADVAAFNEQAKSISVQWAMAKSAILAAAIPIGQLMFPVLTKLAQVAGAAAQAISQHMAQIQAAASAASRAIGQAWEHYAIPAMQEFSQAARRMADEVRRDWPQIRSTSQSVSRSMASALQSIRSAIRDLQPLIRALGPEFKVAFALALLAVRTFAQNTAAGMKATAAVIHGVAPVLTYLVESTNKAAEDIAAAVKAIVSAFNAGFGAVINTIQTLINAIKTLIGWIQKIPSSIHLPSVPHVGGVGAGDVLKGILGFASGGFVPGQQGAPRMVLAHAGEVILNPMQQAALGGAAFFKQTFGFSEGGSSFAGGGIVGHQQRPARSPHHSRRPRYRAASKAARLALRGIDDINQREEDADRSYGQLVRQYDIADTDLQFIRYDDQGNGYISHPDIDQRVSEIDSLIGARNQMLALLDEEKKRLEKAIKDLRVAIKAMLAQIKKERQTIAATARKLSGERKKKKPNQNTITSLQNQISAGGTRIGNLQSMISDFQRTIGDENLNLKHQLPFDVRDVRLDIAQLQQERKDDAGTALPPTYGGGGGGGAAGGPNVAELLAEIAKLQLALNIQGAQSGLIGSFAKGTLSVPETGLALVHAGEQIVPAGQVRGGDGASLPPLQVNIHVDDAMSWLKPFIRAEAVHASDAISIEIGRRANARARSGGF